MSNMIEDLVAQNPDVFHGDYADQEWQLSCGTHEIQTLMTNQKKLNKKLHLFSKIPT